MIVLPLALGLIFLILYLQFKSVITTSLVFSGIMIAWAGGFIMVPMAIPSFGGMTIAIMRILVVPVLYCAAMEWKLKLGIKGEKFAENA